MLVATIEWWIAAVCFTFEVSEHPKDKTRKHAQNRMMTWKRKNDDRRYVEIQQRQKRLSDAGRGLVAGPTSEKVDRKPRARTEPAAAGLCSRGFTARTCSTRAPWTRSCRGCRRGSCQTSRSYAQRWPRPDLVCPGGLRSPHLDSARRCGLRPAAQSG